MKQPRKRSLFQAWFVLTATERFFLIGILLIALIGMTARYLHLKDEEAVVYHPPGIKQPLTGAYK